MNSFNDRELGEILAVALNNVGEGVSIIDGDGKIIFFNRTAEKFEDLRAADIVGRSIGEVYKLDEKTSLQLQALKSGRETRDTYHQFTTSKGKRLSVITSIIPVKAGDRTVAVVATARDVSLIRDLLERNNKLVNPMSGKGSGEVSVKRYTFDSIVGESAVIKEAILIGRKVARSSSTVLLFGETGTGKELFAQSIHDASSNRSGPFIGINCAAIPDTLLESILFGTVKGAFTGATDSPGLFAQAGGGTVFLDEVNSMSLSSQAKLLRVLEERSVRKVGDWKDVPISCRIISSTNVDPEVAISSGCLREDLFYRLATTVITIPPLRDRSGDVPLLVRHFICKYNQMLNLVIENTDREMEEILTRYRWPGNVRELEHTIESAMNLADDYEAVLSKKHLPSFTLRRLTSSPEQAKELPPLSREDMPLPDLLRRVETEVISKALADNSHNVSRTAEALGVKRQNLQMRLRKLKLARASEIDEP